MKRQIRLTKKDIRIFFLILILPFVLTYFFEHFGSFKSTSMGYNYPPLKIEHFDEPSHPESPINARLYDRTFTTFLGNIIIDDLYSKKLYSYHFNSEGGISPMPPYSAKIGYYLRGVMEDVLVPLVLIVFGMVFFGLSKVFSVTIDKT
ncbi:MAG: hypothetical protein ACJAXV_000330 [Bacteroidia bacterium]|jgi:hypothetical protein|tara:strand:+ start:3177 stop:3620 length:444 start_codon:yes stop_codon:yes gene_type:complete